jgi:methionyl-tRNA formyltransferase
LNLKVLLLTTETIHHAFFTQNLLDNEVDVKVILEKNTGRIEHKSDLVLKTNDFEREFFFRGISHEINKMTSCLIVDDINSVEVHKYLGNNHFDVCISFGASWIKEKTLSLLPSIKLNLHGGNIQNYRGLDSHLWSTYHLDGTGFLTTLHTLSPELDCGNIVQVGELDINQISEFYMLRSINTKMATQLVLNALNSVEKTGKLISFPQSTKGRYYSAMPTVLHERCVSNFQIIKKMRNSID